MHVLLLSRKHWYLSAALVATVLTGCDPAESSDDVNQDRIYTSYDLHFDGNEDATAARARFLFGGPNGTQLELDNGSTVEFDGDRLAFEVEPITNFSYYERTYAGLVDEGAYVFEDTEGTTYENDVALTPIDFPAGVGPLDNDETYELEWDGPPLEDDEEVNVVLFRVGEEAELASFNQNDEGATSILLTANGLDNVQPGEVTLVMERKRTRDADDAPDAGGRITERYTPENIVVDVNE